MWTDVDVTAVELNPDIAKIYQDFFPDDKVVVADAHQYLLALCKSHPLNSISVQGILGMFFLIPTDQSNRSHEVASKVVRL